VKGLPGMLFVAHMVWLPGMALGCALALVKMMLLGSVDDGNSGGFSSTSVETFKHFLCWVVLDTVEDSLTTLLDFCGGDSGTFVELCNKYLCIRTRSPNVTFIVPKY
jgi:hypothetical protein